MERRKFIRALTGTAAFASLGVGLLLSACNTRQREQRTEGVKTGIGWSLFMGIFAWILATIYNLLTKD